VAASELALWSGVDNFVWADGGSWLESVVRSRVEIAECRIMDFWASIDPEFSMVADLLFIASHRRWLSHDYLFGWIAADIHGFDLEVSKKLGFALCTLPFVGEFCGDAELHYLDDEP
jgi:hypothetical protein